MELNKMRVLLTGATGGIGVEIARILANKGAKLILTGRDESKLNQLRETLNGHGHEVIKANLFVQSDLNALIKQSATLKTNVLINLAGINELSLISDADDEKLNQMMQMNLIVPMQLSINLAKYFIYKSDSMIVNVGSILGSIGYAGSTAYCATKFGLRGFTEALRRELADTCVQVIYFAPRATDTAMNDNYVINMNKELGVTVDSPQLVARMLVETLGKAKSRDRYLGWPEKLFVRLNAIFPSLVDKALMKQLPIIRRYANK